MASEPTTSAEQPVVEFGPVPAANRFGTALPRVSTGLLGLGVLLILAMHVLPPSNQISPWRRTISEYALGSTGWVFDTGVLALAVGSLGVLAALARARVVKPLGAAAVLMFLWAFGLVLIVVFEKYNYRMDGGVGASGTIHRLATLVSFLSLPAAGLIAAGAGAGRPAWRRAAAWTRWTSVASWLCLGLLFYAIGYGVVTHERWWQVFPLGGLERLIAAAEIVLLFVLARWALLAGRSAALADPVGDRRGGTPLVQ
ncbi:MAG TPA: DUF998 domain-containing protein [Pseudonocardia sp.]